MNKAWIEFRLFLAEWLMGKAYDVAPAKSVEGNEIKLHIAQYFDHKIRTDE